MEIMLPMLALGGVYAMAKQKKRREKETFVTNKIRELEDVSMLGSESFRYPSSRVATENYVNQTLYQDGERTDAQIPPIYSMSGEYLTPEQFTHDNMVPFNGGKVRGGNYKMDVSESIMDTMTGSGSQHNRKIERAPLFKPEEHMQYAYGTPNNSDFYQSRVNAPTKMNNVKPFESEQVGPGLNQGYGTQGTGGFNSGMESRDKWMPKTVDELRVNTNPKNEYTLEGFEGPANSFIKTAGSQYTQGKVEKQRPDTYYVNSADRWLTTTGIKKGETLRSIENPGIVRRTDAQTNFMGPATSDHTRESAPENYEPAKKPDVKTGLINGPTLTGKGPINHQPLQSHNQNTITNNRSTTNQPETLRNQFSSTVGAVIAPLLDVLKATKKDETMYNTRIYGDATGHTQSYLTNNQPAPTTIKETTLYSPNFYINNQKESTYINNYSKPDDTQRNTTNISYYGDAISKHGNTNYTAAYNQHNNEIKPLTIHNRINPGNTNLFNPNINAQYKDDSHISQQGYVSAPFSKSINNIPTIQTQGVVHKDIITQPSMDRISPDLLQAFKNNPFTKSLHSVA